MGGTDLPAGLDPGATRHPDIHDHDMGMQPRHSLDHGVGVPGLADHVEAGLRLQETPEAEPDQLVIVAEEDPDRFGVFHAPEVYQPHAARDRRPDLRVEGNGWS